MLWPLIFVGFWWVVTAFSMHHNRSKYRNCYFLMLAIMHTTVYIVTWLNRQFGDQVVVGFFELMVVVLLCVPVFLVWNGLVMIHREGRSFANLLSLLLGIIVGLGEVAAFLFLLGMDDQFTFIPHIYTYVIFISVFYGSLSFVCFMIYTLFMQIIPHRRDFDYVIIHGSGLIHGDQVSKLLSQRIDKAIEIYRKDPTPPILIPSGGQGSDESVSEAKAMGDYLRSKGIPEDHIIEEGESKTTYENIVNSKRIIEERNDGEYVALVTSNYHVYRALRYAKQVNFKCVGIGSRVASYYWPSALIREYVAVHKEPKHLIIFILGWLVLVLPFIL